MPTDPPGKMRIRALVSTRTWERFEKTLAELRAAGKVRTKDEFITLLLDSLRPVVVRATSSERE